ncbi:MAG: MXAN_6577-like cysteine-rich protein, partial [Nannocystaceae bacterium]
CAPANNAGGATESEGETDGTLDGGEDDVGVEECEPTLASIQTSIFDARCSTEGCHGAESPAASLSLTPGNSLPQLVEVASTGCEGEIRVVPGQREGSLLYQKLLPSPVCGERMPFGGELPAAHIECIGAWIDTLEGSDCEKCGGDVCVDLTSDPIHCGECDLACPPGVGCEQGVCVCPDGQTACGEACVNTLGDVNHCGGCGNVCADGKVCYLGLCADTCADLEDCGGSCVDLSMDPMNCGACGTTCDVGAVCDGGSCACDPTPVSFAAEVLPVLVDRCTSLGCHAPPMPRANLDLTAAVAFSELVGISTNQCGGQRTRVIPGDPAASYVVQKLDGTDLCFGTQMPKGAPPLSNQVRATIKTWICQGAQDN